MRLFKVGAFELPVLAGLDLTQNYEPMGGEAILRAGSGRGIMQRTWRKTRVITSGSGWVPAGLQSLDFDAQHLIACIQPETVPADPITRQATLPTTRRADTDHLPYGLAEFADGYAEKVAATLVGNVATVEAVAGAVRYQVGYLPLLLCWVKRPGRGGPSHAWELVCEEV